MNDTQPTEPRPNCCTDKHLTYLDALRKSGATNMFGAAEYLEREFRLGRDDARAVLLYWMRTFSTRHPQGD